MRRRTMWRAAILSVLATTPFILTPASAGAATIASASPDISTLGLPSKFKSWDELFKVQERLDEAAADIERVVAATSGSNYTNVWVDAETNSLTLYWRGQPTSTEQKMIDSVRARGIGVKLVPAKFSRAQLDAQIDVIGRDGRGSAAEQLVYATKATDGSGVRVGVRRLAGASARADAHSTEAVGALGRSLPHLQAAVNSGGISVIDAGLPVPFTREADRDPYWGGALVGYNGIWDRCTSGFAVRWPADGFDYMTTAAHCRGVGFTWGTPGGPAMGPGTPGRTNYDVMFIRATLGPNGGGTRGRIYVGPRAYMPGQFSAPVKGASRTADGDWLCVSGAYTGWACALRASGNTCWFTNPVFPGVCNPVEGAISSVGQLVAGIGDSGAPVWLPINGIGQPNSAVNARGSVSAGPEGFLHFCPDPINGGERICSTAIWFTDILDAIAPWAGMHVKTE
jgi:hypothetical protein